MTSHYIVTPVRNAIHTIDATIWSIVSQIGDIDIHYHIQDAASTDGTLDRIEVWAERLKKIAGQLTSRVHFSYESKPDAGMYDAISQGFARMEIPPDAFMSWCNADDALWPGALASIARLGQDLPDVDWIMGWPSWFDDNERFVAIERNPRYPQAILAAGLADGIHWPFVQQESTFWRKRLWDKAGGLDVSMRLAGDWNLWIKFAKLTPLVHAHRQLGAFYVRPGQQSSNIDRYRAEMESSLPQGLRCKELRALGGTAQLRSVPVAIENDSGHWLLRNKFCSRQSIVAAKAFVFSPVAIPSLSKLFYKLW